MPPLVGGLQLPHLNKLVLAQITPAAQMHTRATRRNIQESITGLQPIDGDREEVPLEDEDGGDAAEALALDDKSGDVLDPIGIQVLQLDLVVI